MQDIESTLRFGDSFQMPNVPKNTAAHQALVARFPVQLPVFALAALERRPAKRADSVLRGFQRYAVPLCQLDREPLQAYRICSNPPLAKLRLQGIKQVIVHFQTSPKERTQKRDTLAP
jgi:hypothetical protein